MLTTGITIFLAFWLLWIKLPILTRLKALGHPFILDLTVSSGVWIMYSGTGDGLIGATAAAIAMSINISMARYLFGYLETRSGKWYYVVGKINQSDKIARYKEKKHYEKLRSA